MQQATEAMIVCSRAPIWDGRQVFLGTCGLFFVWYYVRLWIWCLWIFYDVGYANMSLILKAPAGATFAKMRSLNCAHLLFEKFVVNLSFPNSKRGIRFIETITQCCLHVHWFSFLHAPLYLQVVKDWFYQFQNNNNFLGERMLVQIMLQCVAQVILLNRDAIVHLDRNLPMRK